MKTQKLKNATTGTRFTHGSHSSVMIVTDFTTHQQLKKERLCVSENGFSEFISLETEICLLPKEVKDIIIRVSSEAIRREFVQSSKH